MIRATLTALALLASPVSAQEDEPLFTTDFRGHEIVVHPNGTWQFSDPDVTLATISPFASGGCLASSGGRVTYCGLPEGFEADRPVSAHGLEEHGFTDQATRLQFTLSLDTNYGHGGDLAYYSQLGSSVGEGFMLKAMSFLTGFEFEGETATVRDGIAVVENGFTIETEGGSGLTDFSIEVMTEKETLSVQASAWSSADAALPDMEDVLARLTANLSIDGKPLAAWKAAE
ncbi:hypothetical protein [Vannielia litorea]|uniref:hypothetical protein n=1 Tax=Vannielia litorea TaxID=1217970 RepID=UPI001C95BCCC|nr:hypothetical protein [Vannielia litorea]MBY6047337.1 hypothetical protein [Vannielia litorea]MBY6074751.1 hypothetical protein [Vannielia litorea]